MSAQSTCRKSQASTVPAYLRRKLEEGTNPAGEQTVTAQDWQRFAEVFADLDDPAVMDAAWR